MTEEEPEEQPEEQEQPPIETALADPRFQNTNVTNWCFATFVDYHRCRRLLGEENECCEQFAKIFKSICPNDWVSRWEDQLEVGTFPLDIPPEDCKD
ncbi:cytochrome c oxidase subunit 6b-2-like [Anoplophora glabripennis]|uniref:cytochrome c oxidase subunit 6b-2-like n=1 Tax=Anoplophora glabripennis TaxID=217634 RepID=UPI000C78B2FE|nr:cytochrome c oxidase subunit 6b-2-like [Anoplophora glabripennis]